MSGAYLLSYKRNWQSFKSISRIPLTYFSLAHLNCQDDPEAYDGAPVGLQIVARKHEEEIVWAIGKIIDGALKTMG